MKALIDLFFPRYCVCCGDADIDLCTPCLASLLVGEDRAHQWQILTLTDDVPVWSVGEYCGVLRRFVLAAKHQDSFKAGVFLEEIGFHLGWVCARSAVWAGVGEEHACLWIVPAPSRFRRRFAGREVVLPLACGVARGLASGLGVRCEVVEACRLRWGTGSQSGRSGRDRREGRVGSMRSVVDIPPGVGVVCVDDIVTTGATIREMARSLRCEPLAVLCLARVGS